MALDHRDVTDEDRLTVDRLTDALLSAGLTDGEVSVGDKNANLVRSGTLGGHLPSLKAQAHVYLALTVMVDKELALMATVSGHSTTLVSMLTLAYAAGYRKREREVARERAEMGRN